MHPKISEAVELCFCPIISVYNNMKRKIFVGVSAAKLFSFLYNNMLTKMGVFKMSPSSLKFANHDSGSTLLLFLRH